MGERSRQPDESHQWTQSLDTEQNTGGSTVSGPRIVLGLDYGTTYTGLAWIQTTGQDSPSVSDVKVFKIWPERDAQKVPSAYSYSKTLRRRKQWGYSIDDESQVMRWTKLQLEPRTTVKELDILRELVKGLDLVNELQANEDAAITNDIPRHISKDAGDVVRDFLGKVSREWVNALYFVTLVVAQCIEPFKLTRVGGITAGGKYGATFIDREFLEWLQPRLTNLDIQAKDFGTAGHFVLMPKGRVLLERFERVKHAFSGTEKGDISLPRGTIVSADQQDGLESGVISLTENDLRKMFDKSVRGTVGLIAKQVVQVQNPTGGEIPGQVTNIFLSGGFSESEYLFNEVKEFADRGNIDVQRAQDCWSGVVKGAVLRGMGIGMDVPVPVMSCPRHYGICISQVYADWMHNGETTVIDSFNRRQVVPKQLIWLVRRGDVILPGRPIVSTFSTDCKFTRRHLELGESVRMTVVATAIENPPSNLSDLPRDLNSIPRSSHQPRDFPDGGDFYYNAVVDAEFQVSQEMTARFKCGGRTLKTYTTTL
ncbi:hypothetical protein FGG08_005909 [Glutinoglossum americanum]|uniref:Uncharacterized protein n=1 Tax=Glutinoglossum americanum TaxID=1670608 RepID=A0A9P8L2G9_9PEZI|nr:hypothetical protein FGG08_005909 [Glutinoglossum americanum]